MNWHIGTVGFGYKQWVGSFYPLQMKAAAFLPHYAQYFDSVEIDSTFYGTPSAATVRQWRSRTPAHFTFCPKTPKAISHGHLPSAIKAMHQFVDVMSELGDKLGCILIQFPPSFTLARGTELRHFAEALPSGIRFALEFRDVSWQQQRVIDWLHGRDLAWVCADYIHLPPQVIVSAAHLYFRFIGIHQQFATKDHEIIDQTERLKMWLAQLETPPATAYAFFNNDFSGHSPVTANRFKTLVGQTPRSPQIIKQATLF